MQTDPNATVGGLYDKPQAAGPLILGTDNEGQSVIANLVYGTRTSLIVGLLAGIIATVIGLLVGLVAGYRGGWSTTCSPASPTSAWPSRSSS